MTQHGIKFCQFFSHHLDPVPVAPAYRQPSDAGWHHHGAQNSCNGGSNRRMVTGS